MTAWELVLFEFDFRNYSRNPGSILEQEVKKHCQPLPAGTIINASFEFDIPVWFENDKFSWTQEGYQKDPQTEKVAAIYRLGNLPVQEQNSPSFTLVSFRSCSSRI